MPHGQAHGHPFGPASGMAPVGPVPELADGYYYQLNVASTTPGDIAPGSWIAGPNLKNGVTNVGYEGGVQAAAVTRAAVLIRKAAGMTLTDLFIWFGYAFTGSVLDSYHSASVNGPWLPIPFTGASANIPHGGVFSYAEYQITDGGTGPFGPYTYIMSFGTDNGVTNTRAGFSEITVSNGGLDVGP